MNDLSSQNSVHDRLQCMLLRRCPLVEFGCSLNRGVSAEVVCEFIHRLSEALVAYPMAPPTEVVWGRSISIQMDPHAALSLGMVLSRVQLNPDQPAAGFKWSCLGYGKLDEALAGLVEGLSLSQPGAYDDAQPWP
jgi:hypothetical protein